MNKFALALLLFAASTSVAFAEIQPAPVPDGEPQSAFWNVSCDAGEVGVFTARTADAPFRNYNYGGEYGFVSIDADEPVRLVVQPTAQVGDAGLTVRPLSLGIKAKPLGDNKFELVVPPLKQVSVETNGREHPLLVFVNPIDENVPTAASENTVYFGPGVHDPEGSKVSLTEGQTLYLAPGAVVRCGVEVLGDNVKIRGRGIIDSTPWDWTKGPTGRVVSMVGVKNVSIEGVIVRGASRWTVVPINCDGVSIRNLKICGGRVQNDDGINPCNSRNVSVRNAFVRTDDDCAALKGLDVEYGNCEDVSYEDCVFWCDRARIALLGHESRAPYMRRITFRNIDVIHSQARNFLLEPGENMRLEDLTFENIRFETGPENALSADAQKKTLDVGKLRFDVDTSDKENWLFVGRPAVNQYMKTQVPGYIKNCVIRDISVVGPLSYCGILFSGANEEHTTDGLRIENVEFFGEKQGADSPSIHIGDFITGVEIK